MRNYLSKKGGQRTQKKRRQAEALDEIQRLVWAVWNADRISRSLYIGTSQQWQDYFIAYCNAIGMPGLTQDNGRKFYANYIRPAGLEQKGFLHVADQKIPLWAFPT